MILIFGGAIAFIKNRLYPNGGVKGTCLQGTEQLASWQQLVSILKLDFKLTLGSRIDLVNNRLGYMFTKCRPRISLETPFDSLLGMDRRCAQRCRRAHNGRTAKNCLLVIFFIFFSSFGY